MVAGDGHLKVLDFGLAKELHADGPGDPTLTSAGQTALGLVMGTPAYMSPEQVEGRPAHASSDIFSLGVVLYEMAPGRRPFQGDSAPALMSSILRDAPALPSHVRSGLSREVDEVVTACLDKAAGRRPAASELRDRLGRMRDGAHQPAAVRLTRPAVLVPAMLGLVTVIALLAWTAVGPQPEGRVRGRGAAAHRDAGKGRAVSPGV